MTVWDGLLVLVGPTAVGKTAAAIQICRRLDGEIVSADSMQIYRGFDIGAAKPSTEERAQAPFHLIDFVEPDRQYTVADWKQDAETAISDIRMRGKAPVIAGGTGLYIRALLDDWKLAGTPRASDMREQLMAEAATEGAPALHRQLTAVDPVTAARLHPNDLVRVVRALEVYHATGVPISEHLARDHAEARPRKAVKVGLTMPRPMLYERIDRRVVEMIASGFEQEVRRLLDQGISANTGPMRSLGYKEMAQYIGGELTYSDMLLAVKQNTRRYAKRQQTWFNADKSIHWIDVSALSSASVAGRVIERLESERIDPSNG